MGIKLRSKLMLLFMSLAMVVAIPAVALADTLQINNTLVVGSNVSKDSGQSGTGKVWLETDDNKTDPQNGCNATLTSPVTVTFTSSDKNKIANPAPVTLTDCGTGAAKDFSYNVASSATAGTVQISGQVSGGRGGTYTTTDTLTVTINAPAKQNTGISNVSGSGTYGGDATLTAKLSSGSNNLSGKNVAFELNGQAVGTDATDANGVAELSGVSLSGTNAGPHNNAVSANFTGDSGYNGSSGSGNLSVAKANAVIDVQGFNGVYDGQAHGASGSATGVDGSNLDNLLDLGASFTNAPGGTANWSFAGNANHNPANGSVQIDIAKASSNTEVSCPVSKTYTGQPLTPCTVSVTGAGGLSLSPAANYSNNTNAGQAMASYTYAGGTNHNGSSDSKTFTIEKAEAVIDVQGFNGVYDGQAHGASGSATGVDGSNLDNLLDLGASFTNAPGGTANWSFAGNANHKAASGSVQINIAKATPQITWSNPAAIDYGTALSGAQLNAQADVAGSFAYTPTAGIVPKAGTQTLKANFTPADSVNYNSASKTVSLVVNPYSFTGFFQPIDMSGALNKAKAGSTIPVKFSLGGDKGMNVLAQTPSAGKIACDPAAQVDAIEELSTATTSGLKYDPVANQYIYNWKTTTSYAGTCQQLVVRLADGTTVKSANFTFTK